MKSDRFTCNVWETGRTLISFMHEFEAQDTYEHMCQSISSSWQLYGTYYAHFMDTNIVADGVLQSSDHGNPMDP
jgi:hypothetical protein